MHARRLACFLLGLWLAGGLFMAWVATQNFHEVDRLLSHSDPVATLHFRDLGDHARPLMRYQASELNRWLFEKWEIVQLAGGGLFLVLMLFWSHENKTVLAGILLLLALTAIERLLLTPHIIALGRVIDFIPPDTPSPDRRQFWVAHTAYAGVECAKWGLMLLLTGRMVFSSKRSGRSRNSRRELDGVDKRYDRRVNR